MKVMKYLHEFSTIKNLYMHVRLILLLTPSTHNSAYGISWNFHCY